MVRHQLKLGVGDGTVSEVISEAVVTGDRLRVAASPVMQECHPDLQRAKRSGLLEAVLAEPGEPGHPVGVGLLAQIGRDEAEGVSHQLGISDEHDSGVVRDVEPFVRVDGERISSTERLEL